MRITDIISMCLRNLWRRKVRTLLTVSGVVIGSCAIIVMISLGLGVNVALDAALGQMGSLNKIDIYSSYGSSEGVKLDDTAMENIRAIEGVDDIFAVMESEYSQLSVTAGKNNRYRLNWAMIVGVYPDTLEKFGYKAAEGDLSEFKSGSRDKIVIGSEIPFSFTDSRKRGQNAYRERYNMNGEENEPFFEPLDTDILIYVNKEDSQDNKGNYKSGGKKYEHTMQVAAILQEDWAVSEYASYGILMDVNTLKDFTAEYNKLNGVKKPKELQYSRMMVYVNDIDKVGDVQSQIIDMGFNCSSMEDTRNEMKGMLAKVQLVLGGLAAISLFVAAIGITNTMIMSIYERTREIGVMKVLGCYISNIRAVFLCEAGCIGMLGGVMGVTLSFILSFVLNAVVKNIPELAEIVGDSAAAGTNLSIIPPWLVLLSLGFSTLIGLISGFYPANRAVKISALEAIKNE